MAGYLPIGGGGTGGGILYPESASRPFNSNSARNTWANNNKKDLIKDTTVVNVGGSQWYLWTGESNPDTVQSSLWMDADQIVPGEKGDRGDPGVDVTAATINADGDLIVTLSNGTDLNAGVAKGADGDLVYQLLPMADYGNFFDADWANLGTNIYGLTGDGAQFANGPFNTVGGQEYSFEILLVNEPNQYSMRITLMEAGDNSGRDAILAGTSKAAAEAEGWKIYAFTSDAGHADPTDGFDLKPNADIGLDSTSAITIKNNAGDIHNAIDQDINLDAIRLGSPVMRTYLRTGRDRMQVQTTNGMKEIAHLEDIPSPTNPVAPARFAYQVREGEYFLTEDQIQQEILLAVQPMVSIGDDKVTNIVFPDQATFERHYYIPGINDADSATKPHIESFRFSLWQYQFQTDATKVILTSNGNWLPFVSSEILDEYNGIYIYRESQSKETDLHTFAFMRPINFNPAVGLNGWAFQSIHPEQWIPLSQAVPPSDPVATLGTFMIDDDESSHLRTGAGITSTFDPLTGDHTLTVDPTNIDLSDYAELDTNVSFSRIDIKNPTDIDNFISTVNVTNGGNTDVNLVGTTNLRKRNKATGDLTDVVSINGTSGAVDLKTDVTYQGAIDNDKSPVTKEYLEQFGRGIGVPEYVLVEGGNTYQQTSHIGAYQSSGTNVNDIVIEIDTDLLESETIISMPTDSFITTKNFDVVQVAGQGTSKNIRSGDTWRVRMILDQAGTNRWFWEKIYTGGGNVVYGLSGRLDIIEDVSVKAFAYAENMPYHLLLETPTSSRLFHEFPRSKTFRFTPISTGREHDGNVVINQANQGVATGDLELGQYSDLPLYVIEPNVVVNRDQRAWINFPANMTIDTSEGFYAFGTISGWCGNSSTEGNVGVYVGNSENFRSYTQNIGFVLGNNGIFILDGQNLRTAQNSVNFGFNIEPGVTHMYRYAFYVDPAGLMTYYVVDLNTGQVSSSTQQCNLASIGSNPKMYISYDRYSNNTAAIAIAETHLVLNSVGGAEGRWNWRN